MLADEPDYVPYAPAGNVLSVIHRLREHGLKEVVTSQELARLSIPEATAHRTLKALRFLGLLDEDGRQTATFQRLGRASTEDYPELLEEVLRAAYDDVFAIVDPAAATDIQLANAFRNYEPRAQRPRMINLFLGLCREAEMVPPERVSAPRSSPAKRTAAKKQAQGSSERAKPAPPPEDRRLGDGSQLIPPDRGASANNGGDNRYQLLYVLLSQLPREGKWTKKRRDQWLGAVTANIDLLVEVVENEDQNVQAQVLALPIPSSETT